MDVTANHLALKSLVDVAGKGPGGIQSASASSMDHPAFGVLYDKARENINKIADQFVATTFFYPLLQQVSDSPFKTDRFDGGFTEQAFRQQLNERLADNIAAGHEISVSSAIGRQLMDWLKNQPVETVERIAQEVDVVG